MRKVAFWGSLIAVGALMALTPALGSASTHRANWRPAAKGGLDCKRLQPGANHIPASVVH